MITKKASLPNLLKNVYLTKKEPVSIVHFITNRCNARCSFCFIDFDNPKVFEKELTIDEIKSLTKNLGNSLLNVNLTGGEPFARKDILDIAKAYIDNTTIQSMYVTTNGSLPERVINFAKKINDYNNELELTFQISIDDFPTNHDRVRKISNLFEKCIETFWGLKNLKLKNVNPVISITVTHENCDDIQSIFEYIHNKCQIDSIKCTIVRDEGVYKTPEEKRKKILDAYEWLTNKITNEIEQKKLSNYNSSSLQGRLHQKKDKLSWEIIKKTYLNPHFISPCHAGSLFGIIGSKGEVYPCEILENKKLGDLRDNNMEFMKMWQSNENNKIKKFIKSTNCNCTYECALSFNILGNYRYQLSLIRSALNVF